MKILIKWNFKSFFFQKKGTHFNEEGMNRRLPIYRKFNPLEEND